MVHKHANPKYDSYIVTRVSIMPMFAVLACEPLLLSAGWRTDMDYTQRCFLQTIDLAVMTFQLL